MGLMVEERWFWRLSEEEKGPEETPDVGGRPPEPGRALLVGVEDLLEACVGALLGLDAVLALGVVGGVLEGSWREEAWGVDW